MVQFFLMSATLIPVKIFQNHTTYIKELIDFMLLLYMVITFLL